ncbi:nitrogen permease regulator of amino acid transport activity 3-domain-containing protein [Pelagophyceae sp. CCMP2097]|nr:nitrogen permease regulator of amino acid transport activity 3-domain-containing protein [Pelagophyceae sp. CCMP2097]
MAKPLGVSLIGFAVIVEDDAPSLALRYSAPEANTSAASELFESFSDTQLAKLFGKRRCRERQVELQIEDVLFLSTTAVLTDDAVPTDDSAVLLSGVEDDDAPEADGADESTWKKVAFFNVVAVAKVSGSLSLQSLKAVATDVVAALVHEERRCSYVSRQAALMLRDRAQASSVPLARELDAAFRSTARGCTARATFNGWVTVCRQLHRVRVVDDDDEDAPARRPQSHFATSDEDWSAGDDCGAGEACDTAADARAGPAGDGPAEYAPYEALLLLDDTATVLVALPASASPELRAVVAAADATRYNFDELARLLDLPYGRVCALARHVVAWRRGRVVTKVDADMVYAVAPNAPVGGAAKRRSHPDLSAATSPAPAAREAQATDEALAAIGAAKSFGDAVAVLARAAEARGARDARRGATEAVLALLRSGALRELHTYVVRIDDECARGPGGREDARGPGGRAAAPQRPDGLPSSQDRVPSTSPATPPEARGADAARHCGAGGTPPRAAVAVAQAARRAPPRAPGDVSRLHLTRGDGDDDRPRHLRLLHIFYALAPYFDGRTPVVEMMWRERLDRAEIFAALHAFGDLLITVQREMFPCNAPERCRPAQRNRLDAEDAR